MVAVGDVQQVGSAGRPVERPPAVRVIDANGAGVPDVLVTFEADPGSGTTAGREIATGPDGTARVGSWTLGPDPGTQRVRARADGLPDITFVAIATVPPAVFDIEIRFNNAGGTPAQRMAFRVAEARWQAVLQGEAPDVAVAQSAGFCGSNEALDETVDDLLILADIEDIDGAGGVLGSAGPCLVRSGSSLPILGRMRFDRADLDNLEAGGTLDDVIVHEMGHVLGIGTLWVAKGLLADSAAADTTRVPDPHFTGPAAQVAFEQVGGFAYVGARVPVEDSGGAGTRLSHWRETVFDNELMTGFIDQGSNPLSLVTIASLEDLGYVVDRGVAEAYALSLSRRPAGGSRTRIALGSDILDEPIYEVDRAGRIRPLIPR